QEHYGKAGLWSGSHWFSPNSNSENCSPDCDSLRKNRPFQRGSSHDSQWVFGVAARLHTERAMQSAIRLPLAADEARLAYHRPENSMPRANLIALFESFAIFGSDVAVVERRGYRRETTTYAQLQANALAWNRRLAANGVEPGDRVLLWGPNSSAWM